MLHSAQTANPRNSANTDRPRLRRAMTRPTAAHWPASSGFQPSIQRPGRCVSGAACWAGAVSRTGAVPVPVASWCRHADLRRTGGVCVDDDARERMFRPTCPPGCACGSIRAPVAAGACEIRRAAAPARCSAGTASRTVAPTCRPSCATCAGGEVDEHVAGGPQAHAGGAGFEVDHPCGPAAVAVDDHRAGRERHLRPTARRGVARHEQSVRTGQDRAAVGTGHERADDEVDARQRAAGRPQHHDVRLPQLDVVLVGLADLHPLVVVVDRDREGALGPASWPTTYSCSTS